MFGYNFVLTGQVMGKAGVYGLFPCRRSTNNVYRVPRKNFQNARSPWNVP